MKQYILDTRLGTMQEERIQAKAVPFWIPAVSEHAVVCE